MLEAQIILLQTDRDPEPGIVHHPQNTPIHIPRLDRHALIHTPDKDILRIPQLRQRDIDIPETPAEGGFAPLHVNGPAKQLRPRRLPVPVFGVIDIRQPPRLALIERDLDTRDPAPTTTIRVPLRAVELRRADQTKLFLVRRIRDRRVARKVEDGIPLVHPPRLVIRALLRAHRRRQHAVVVDVVPVVAGLVRDDELLEPLDAAAADLAWDHRAQRLAVVRAEHLAVHLVREHHASVGVHGPVQLDRGAVVAVGELVGALHAHVSGAALGLGDFEQLLHHCSGPERGGDAGGAPGEAFGFADDVLLFSSVAGAHEGYRTGDLGVAGYKVFEGECYGVLYESGDYVSHNFRSIPSVLRLTLQSKIPSLGSPRLGPVVLHHGF